MHLFKNTFTTIQNMLNQHVSIPFIDLWNEEIDLFREEHATPMPAVFVEFLPVTWNTIGSSNDQHGYSTIKIYVIQNIITDSYLKTF
jgi:hypothetical protein